MPAPEVIALDRAEIAVPQEEGRAVLSVGGDVWRVARVPPRIPREGADGRIGRWFEHVEERSAPAVQQRCRNSGQKIVQKVACRSLIL